MAFFRTGKERVAEAAFLVDGAEVRGREGEALAVALGVAGMLRLRDSPRMGAPRGGFCFAGSCQGCVVLVDGVQRPACMTPVRAGMRVDLRSDARGGG